ncbi:hypothetical protein VNO80_21828 [Phaseolus coccineus]|uniref:Uncharacterized protein n=1 Tax=Phaseolus coccineus TaxID=3886 RepID=A0AAN9QY31_PHACN
MYLTDNYAILLQMLSWKHNDLILTVILTPGFALDKIQVKDLYTVVYQLVTCQFYSPYCKAVVLSLNTSIEKTSKINVSFVSCSSIS